MGQFAGALERRGFVTEGDLAHIEYAPADTPLPRPCGAPARAAFAGEDALRAMLRSLGLEEHTRTLEGCGMTNVDDLEFIHAPNDLPADRARDRLWMV
eukprot:gene49512-18270_t